MDIYMYPFGEPGHPIVLRDGSYSDVSPYMAVSPGFGGTAPRLPTDPAPWLLTIAARALLTSGGFAGLLRSGRGRPVTG